MRNKILWLGALLLTLITALLLADAESRYVRLVAGLDDVEVELIWNKTRTEQTPEKITLYFEAVFRNTSDLTLYVEALNTQLFINGEYAGAHSITEGRFQVPSQGERAIPLQAVLWESRAELFRQALEGSRGRLEVTGRTRISTNIGGTALKAFYDVHGAFPLAGGFELKR